MDGYRLWRRLGRGVYSQVYEALDPAGRTVAIKSLQPGHYRDAWVLECFRREGLIGRKIDHPGLIRIHHSRLETPPYYHVCRPVQGHSLRDAALLPTPIVLSVIAQIAGALAALHRAGFVHGDVKPGNILLAADGRATLIDLGFARVPGSLSFQDGLPGTPNYLAPELCRRDFRDTAAADVFALGVTAYELLTGELPWPRLDDTESVLRLHRNTPPQKLMDHEASELVNGMLDPDLFTRWKMTRVVQRLQPQRQAA